MAVLGPGRVELLDHALKGRILVGVSVQVRVPDALDELRGGGVSGRIGPQHQGVDEEAHQFVELGVRAARHRGAERDVLARAGLGEQGRERGLQHHKEAGVVLACQSVEPGAGFRTDGKGNGRRRFGGALRAADEVERQPQFFGGAAQFAGPELELAGDGTRRVVLAAQFAALPEREVGVLDGKRREGRVRAGRQGVVGDRQILRERGQRPAVRGNMVQRNSQHMVVRAQLEQDGAQRQIPRDVEAAPGFSGQGTGQSLFGALDGQQLHRALAVGEDLLGGFAVEQRENRPQALVAARHQIDCTMKRRYVQRALELQHHGDVVGAGPGVEAVQEPEPALGERERNDGRAFHRPERVRAAGSQLKGLGEGSDGGLFKHRAQGRGHAGPVPQQGHESGRQQGVAAEFEEVVVQPHGVEPQYLLESLSHDPFPLAPGRCGGGFLFRRGKRACVQLAVGGQRDG